MGAVAKGMLKGAKEGAKLSAKVSLDIFNDVLKNCISIGLDLMKIPKLMFDSFKKTITE